MGKSESVWYLAEAVFLTIVCWIASEIDHQPNIPRPNLSYSQNCSAAYFDAAFWGGRII